MYIVTIVCPLPMPNYHEENIVIHSRFHAYMIWGDSSLETMWVLAGAGIRTRPPLGQAAWLGLNPLRSPLTYKGNPPRVGIVSRGSAKVSWPGGMVWKAGWWTEHVSNCYIEKGANPRNWGGLICENERNKLKFYFLTLRMRGSKLKL